MSARPESRRARGAPEDPFKGVQRIVLRGGHWEHARHLVLRLEPPAAGRHFLKRLLQQGLAPTTAEVKGPDRQLSLGFSRRGIEHLDVPRHVLGAFAARSPAFHAGAAMRAGRVGAAGSGGSQAWEPAFGHQTLDAVLSVHARHFEQMLETISSVGLLAEACAVDVHKLAPLQRLPRPNAYGGPEAPAGQAEGSHEPGSEGGAAPSLSSEQWMHFGYRDGLALVGIEGWPAEGGARRDPPRRSFKAGEFVLGHAQNSGANPWITAPSSTRVWPTELRAFFHNGSFGVLQQLVQHVDEFERYIAEAARKGTLDAETIKAKLCGRTSDGRPLAAPGVAPEADFDYSEDPDGHRCPFGSHIRRMNPRGDRLAHNQRVRPLLRRGMPFCSAAEGPERGLMGHFFCASIEDQFEHLLGQWAERVPLGSRDRGGARDPLIGQHQPGDGAFEIPGPEDPIQLPPMAAFTRTAGMAYLFYPSLQTLEGIADHLPWAVRYEAERE